MQFTTMANEASTVQSNERGIARSWGLLAFVKDHGQPNFIDDFVGTDGKTFCALSFSADTFKSDEVRDIMGANGPRKSSFVSVTLSQNCPARDFDAIVAQRHNLQVVELQRDNEHPYPSYKLCSKGEFETRGKAMLLEP